MLSSIINKNILNNPYFLSFLQILNNFINIFIISIITKYYSLTVFGLIAFSQSTAGIFNTLIDQCFDQYIILKITKEKYKLERIVNGTIWSRFTIIVPLIIVLYLFTLFKTKSVCLGLILISELLKSIIPISILDKKKETYNLIIFSLIERIILLTIIIFLNKNFSGDINMLIVSFSFSGLIYTILSLFLINKKITKLRFYLNRKFIYNEIIGSLKGIPNVISKITFLYYAKLIMGFFGLYNDLGKLAIIQKIANVFIMPTTYYFRLCYSNLIDITKEIKAKVKSNFKKQSQNKLLGIIKIGILISSINLLIMIFIINNKFIINKFTTILSINNLIIPCIILFLYTMMTRFEEIFEFIFIGVFGRKKLSKLYIPGSILSIILLSFIGIRNNLSIIIICFFLGNLSNFIRLTKKIFKNS